MAFSTPAPLKNAHYSRQSFATLSASQSDTHGGAPTQPAFIHGTQSSGAPGERHVEFLTFSCAGIACAAPISAIREVLTALPMIASLPDCPIWFLGLFQLRAEILGAADLGLLLTGDVSIGADASALVTYPALSGHERSIIVGAGAQSLALLVESIGEILTLQAHEILSDMVDHPWFGAIAQRYRLGLLAPDGAQTRFALIALDTLLTDALNALTDQEAPTYAR
jgi:chemotaxis signal transduction protein